MFITHRFKKERCLEGKRRKKKCESVGEKCTYLVSLDNIAERRKMTADLEFNNNRTHFQSRLRILENSSLMLLKFYVTSTNGLCSCRTC